jgi:hypothetical protein
MKPGYGISNFEIRDTQWQMNRRSSSFVCTPP